MISEEYLRELSKRTDLHLYQQEKDYLLKLFLYFYYSSFEDVVFKDGTCLKYVHGLNRFSEDLDFELVVEPEKFQDQVEKVLEVIKKIGIESEYIKEERFEKAYTAEIAFRGPRYDGSKHSRNKFRIDAGERLGLVVEPRWRFIESEYPETRNRFSVLVMGEEELLAEKIISLFERDKGRDLYDVWFMLEKGLEPDVDLIRRKYDKEMSWRKVVDKERYSSDLKRLVRRTIPYDQVREEVKKALQPLLQ